MPDEFYSLLAPQKPIAVVDIGAADYGDEAAPYEPLLKHGMATLIGFEPQRDLCDKLNASKDSRATYLPYVLGDGGSHTWYNCRFPAMSGLKRPNPWLLYQFPPLHEWGEVVGTSQVQTRRLDDIPEVETIDFLKIDVEGSEVDVFRGGQRKLAQTVAIWTEVSFIPIYDGQCLLGDVDIELRRQGFVPHCISGGFIRMIAPMQPLEGRSFSNSGFRQIHAADMVYVRDFARLNALSPEQLKHLALIAHHICHSYDLAYRAIHDLANRGNIPAQIKDRYLEIVSPRPARSATDS